MLQSIQSHYLGPTNHRGARIVAKTASGHRLVVSWDYALNAADNHVAALTALAEKLDWIQGSKAVLAGTAQSNFLVGSTDKGYVMVFR
tara:strand:+ start:54 stop:317 length:264 start_codon:yes stop_codon:yes gene_type:complete